MKKLTNDQCVPKIRAREPFTNHRGSLTGDVHTPGAYAMKGSLPERHRAFVDEAHYIVRSYDTPIAWYGPSLDTSLEAVTRWLDGPSPDELEAYLNGESDDLWLPEVPMGESAWQMPPVRYSVTTTDHQHTVIMALAYEKTWREGGETVPAPHYEQTEYHATAYTAFLKVPCGGPRRGW